MAHNPCVVTWRSQYRLRGPLVADSLWGSDRCGLRVPVVFANPSGLVCTAGKLVTLTAFVWHCIALCWLRCIFWNRLFIDTDSNPRWLDQTLHFVQVGLRCFIGNHELLGDRGSRPCSSRHQGGRDSFLECVSSASVEPLHSRHIRISFRIDYLY